MPLDKDGNYIPLDKEKFWEKVRGKEPAPAYKSPNGADILRTDFTNVDLDSLFKLSKALAGNKSASVSTPSPRPSAPNHARLQAPPTNIPSSHSSSSLQGVFDLQKALYGESVNPPAAPVKPANSGLDSVFNLQKALYGDNFMQTLQAPADEGPQILPYVDRRSVGDKVKDFFSSVFSDDGKIHNTIRAAGDALASGATEFMGLNELYDASFRGDPTHVMGEIGKSLEKQRSEYISPGVETGLNWVGQVAGAIAPTMGAGATGGKLAAKGAEKLFANAPKWLKTLGIGAGAGAGTGATLQTGKELMQAGNDQSLVEHLGDIGENTAYFSAYGAASPIASKLMGAAAEKIGQALPAAANNILSTIGTKAPLVKDVGTGIVEGALTGSMVGAGMAGAKLATTGDPNKALDVLTGEAGDEMKENFVESIALGIVRRLSGKGIPVNPQQASEQVTEIIMEQFPPEVRAKLEVMVAQQKIQGVEEAAAKAKVIDVMGSLPDGKAILEQASAQILQDMQSLQEPQAETEQPTATPAAVNDKGTNVPRGTISRPTTRPEIVQPQMPAVKPPETPSKPSEVTDIQTQAQSKQTASAIKGGAVTLKGKPDAPPVNEQQPVTNDEIFQYVIKKNPEWIKLEEQINVAIQNGDNDKAGDLQSQQFDLENKLGFKHNKRPGSKKDEMMGKLSEFFGESDKNEPSSLGKDDVSVVQKIGPSDEKKTKVVDKKGNPVVVYHGSNNDFTTFKQGDIGFHFGTKQQAASRVGSGKNVKTHEVYLDIRNPVRINKDLGSWNADYKLPEELLEVGAISKDQHDLFRSKNYNGANDNDYNGKASVTLRKMLTDNGYDGIEYINRHEGGNVDKPSWIAFENSQIKRKETINEGEISSVVSTSDSVDTPSSKEFDKMDVQTEAKPAEEIADSESARDKAVGAISIKFIQRLEEQGYEFAYDGPTEKSLKFNAGGVITGKNVDRLEDAGIFLKRSSKEQRIANELKAMISSGTNISSKELFVIADKVYKGTQAEGKYTPKDAYDALELAVNQHLLEQNEMDLTSRDTETVKGNIVKLIELTSKLPTQTKRTEEMEKFQQFSTPPAIAYVASWAADIKKEDTLFEPSAGIGGLAVFGKAAGAKVIVNELDPRRLEVLKQLPFDQFFKEDGEQINNILPKTVKPTVVLMNPPFSTSGDRGIVDTKNSFKHVEQALKRLEPGGRLVSVLGQGREGINSKGFNQWLAELQKVYNVRASIGIDGKNYTKYGTSFNVQYLIIDKTGPSTVKPLIERAGTLEQAIDILEGIARDRQGTSSTSSESEPTAVKPTGVTSAGQDTKARSVASDSGRSSTPSSTNDVGNTGRHRSELDKPRSDVRPNDVAGTEPKPGENDGRVNDNAAGRPDDARPVLPGESRTDSAEPIGSVGTKEDRPRSNNNKKRELTESIFEDYTPKKLNIKNAVKHPGQLAESAAMSAIDLPDLTYKLSLPKNIIEDVVLSDAQLEAVAYAGQAHSQMLPNKQRKGFFIGDGTGVGKGREIAGIILDNIQQGRKKAVWISENNRLVKDARRDWSAMGKDPKGIFEPPSSNKEMKQTEGILFTTYGTIGSGFTAPDNNDVNAFNIGNSEAWPDKKKSRIDQMVDWLGKDFDGVIAFDEAHNMANSLDQSGTRGVKKAAIRALAGVELQNKLPNARIVYVSATGATEVSNFAYAERLGLWGVGTAFPNKAEFINQISAGGIAAMELVARDMKSMGLYISRALSFNGVEYHKLTHNLTDDQTEVYDTLADSWQIILKNIGAAMEITGVTSKGKTANGQAKGRAVGAFWSTQQRFFNQVLIAMQMPLVISEAKKDLALGRSIVMQLVNTNEATQERGINKIQEEEGDLEDIDLTPKDMMLQFLDKSFPVQQHEEYVDDNGNVKSRPVVDSEGNVVISAEALAMKDDLFSRVQNLKVPEGPIEQILNAFGSENVAEITGRGRRIVEKVNEETGRKERVIEMRSDLAKSVDADSFMDGLKRILIFSDAGGTGRSYHADNKAKNKQQRVHYLVQAGWKATSAVQGLGRTHRTDQASAPIYKLFTTNLKGQMRFISSIAKRLDQLGALTKGQRQTGSQGMFSSSDNLEGTLAKDALVLFYTDLGADRIPGLEKRDVLSKMGLENKLLDEYGRFNREAQEATEVTKFLNRILSLGPDLQNNVFEEFQARIEQLTMQSEAAGTLEKGLENLKSDTAQVILETEIRKDESTNSVTKYYQIEVGQKSIPVKLKQLLEDEDFVGVYRNERSKAVRVFSEKGNKTLPNGKVVKRYLLQGQERFDYKFIDEEELKKSTWTKIEDAPEYQALWDEALKVMPSHRKDTIHMISGTLLPVWDRLPKDRVRIVRVSLDNGDILLGRIIPENAIDYTLQKLGADKRSKEIDMDLLVEKILSGHIVNLTNGWKLVKRRVSNEYRIEIVGSDLYKHDDLKPAGVFTEKIGYEMRYFIPTGEDGTSTIREITLHRPIAEVVSPIGSVGNDTFVPQKNEETPVTSTESILSVSKSDVVKYIMKEFKVSLGTGKYRGQQRGLYKPGANVIRTKLFGDFLVLSHELGHRLERKYGLSDEPSVQDELLNLAYDNLQIPENMDEEQVMREGVADFVRMYFYEPQRALNQAPLFHRYFIDKMKEAELESKLNVLSQMLETWHGQTPDKRVSGVIDLRKKRGLRNPLKKLYVNYVDELIGLQEAVEKLTGNNVLLGKDDPHLLAWKNRGIAGKIQTFLEYGVMDDNGKKVSESLKDIINSVEDLDTFRKYLTAKHAITLREEGKWKTPISKYDAEAIVKKTPDEYVEAAEKIYAFQDAVTNLLIRSGMIEPGKLEKWKESRPFYVPFYRVLEESGERDNENNGQGQGKTFANLPQAVQAMKEEGSAKIIIDPIESIIKNTFMYISLAGRNDVGKALARLVDGTPESGSVMEKIDRPMKAQSFQLNEIEGVLKDAGIDLDGVDLEDTATIFRPMFTPSMKDRVLIVWVGGKQQFYQVRDQDLYDALLSLDGETLAGWIKLLSIPNNILRTGITSSPSFIPKGPMRGLPTMLMQSDSYTTPLDFLQLPFDLVKGFMSAIGKGELYHDWLDSGAGQSTLLSIERDYLLESKNRLLHSSAKEIMIREAKTLGLGAVYKSLRYVSQTLDEGFRITEYKKALEKTGDRVVAAVRSRDVDLDFNSFGKHAKNINRLNLFFNVAIKGPNKTYRTFKAHPLRTFVRGTLFLTLPTLALMAMNWDDEDYWELEQWERDLFWNIPKGDGTFVRIPIPFEWGLIFKTIPERIVTSFARDDRKAFDDYFKTIKDTMTPSVIPTFVVPMAEWITETDLSTGNPVLSMGDKAKAPEDQYGMYTSEFAKKIGDALKVSPKKIDHLVKGTTGSLGQMAAKATDFITGGRSEAAEGEKPSGQRGIFERTFVADSADGSTYSTGKFYDLLDAEEKDHKKNGIKGEPHVLLKYLRKSSSEMTTMRKLRDAVANDISLSGSDKGKAIHQINLALTDLARIMTKNDARNKDNLNAVLQWNKAYKDSQK